LLAAKHRIGSFRVLRKCRLDLDSNLLERAIGGSGAYGTRRGAESLALLLPGSGAMAPEVMGWMRMAASRSAGHRDT
jgi:hypothetical protein